MTALPLKEREEMSLKTRCALENMKSSYGCLPSLHDILRVFLFYPKVYATLYVFLGTQ
jgi:hypothetical protein